MAGPVDDVACQARLQPGRIAAIDLASGQRWTYAELDRDIGACARVIAGHGLRLGDRLAAFAHNHVLLAILHAACARLGVIYVPLNWRLAEEELASIVADAEPALLIYDDDRERGMSALSLVELGQAITAAAPLETEPHDGHRPSLILYTSGTSGQPKGALLSERNLAETAINIGVLARIGNASRVLNDSPMFHVIGLVINIRAYWLQGGTVLVSGGFDAARTIALIADPELGVTHYFCVPAMAAMLRQHADFAADKFRSLTAVFTGGAPNPAAEIIAWLDDGIAMVNGYGMSENGTLICMPVAIDEIRKRPTSAGVPTARVEVRVVDQADRPVPPGTPGEIQVRGPNLASGYWRRPEETAKTFLPDGWFVTGDIATIDAEGFVTIADRRKDMYISGGENVYPVEIESVVAGFAGVAHCAAVGVPDATWGEVGHLFVVAVSEVFDGDALRDHLATRLARYKMPKRIILIDELPRNGAGKVQKNLLRTFEMPSAK
ncbi:MAG: AMP-binding protein [Sphingomonadaceae bacterium]|nr:AMP-binding protein [Sphingomonadaceae bacterium]